MQKKIETITIRLTSEDKERLVNLAKKEERSVSWLAQKIIVNRLDLEGKQNA